MRMQRDTTVFRRSALAVTVSWGLFTAPGTALAEEDIPHVFSIDCNWYSSTRIEDTAVVNSKFENDYSSSRQPSTKLQNTMPGDIIEVVASNGARHFLIPNFGGGIVSNSYAIFPDGRATRTQVLRFGSDLTVEVRDGVCEVTE